MSIIAAVFPEKTVWSLLRKGLSPITNTWERNGVSYRGKEDLSVVSGGVAGRGQDQLEDCVQELVLLQDLGREGGVAGEGRDEDPEEAAPEEGVACGPRAVQ